MHAAVHNGCVALAYRRSTPRKLPGAASDKSAHGSGKSEGAIGVGDAHQRGHSADKAV